MKKRISWLLVFAMLLSVILLTGCGKEEKAKPVITTPLLRVGIISDIHLGADTPHSRFDRLEKVLMFYKEKGVDGILITGDLQDDRTSAATAMSNIEELQDIWLRVFPDNTNPLTGEPVEPMFIYGNHDKALVDAEYWFDGIGSEYEDAWIKEIKGYQFVGVHYTKEGGTLVQKYLEQAKEASPDKPFFFAQHVPVAGTIVGGYESYEGNIIPMQESLMRSYNCVMFTGHTHVPITDERAIWQSNSKKAPQFTTVTCGTLHYADFADFCKLEVNGDRLQTQQAMYMVVDGTQVTLERYSFTDLELDYENGEAVINSSNAKQIGTPWVFDAMQTKKRPYDYDTRAQKASEPVFPADAALEIFEITDTSAKVTIPAATVDAPEGFSDLVQSYYVEVIDPTGNVIRTVEIASPYHIDDTPERLNQPVTLTIADLTLNTQYTILAYARECYQKASQPLSAQFTTLQ